MVNINLWPYDTEPTISAKSSVKPHATRVARAFAGVALFAAPALANIPKNITPIKFDDVSVSNRVDTPKEVITEASTTAPIKLGAFSIGNHNYLSSQDLNNGKTTFHLARGEKLDPNEIEVLSGTIEDGGRHEQIVIAVPGKQGQGPSLAQYDATRIVTPTQVTKQGKKKVKVTSSSAIIQAKHLVGPTITQEEFTKTDTTAKKLLDEAVTVADRAKTPEPVKQKRDFGRVVTTIVKSLATLPFRAVKGEVVIALNLNAPPSTVTRTETQSSQVVVVLPQDHVDQNVLNAFTFATTGHRVFRMPAAQPAPVRDIIPPEASIEADATAWSPVQPVSPVGIALLNASTLPPAVVTANASTAHTDATRRAPRTHFTSLNLNARANDETPTPAATTASTNSGDFITLGLSDRIPAASDTAASAPVFSPAQKPWNLKRYITEASLLGSGLLALVFMPTGVPTSRRRKSMLRLDDSTPLPVQTVSQLRAFRDAAWQIVKRPDKTLVKIAVDAWNKPLETILNIASGVAVKLTVGVAVAHMAGPLAMASATGAAISVIRVGLDHMSQTRNAPPLSIFNENPQQVAELRWQTIGYAALRGAALGTIGYGIAHWVSAYFTKPSTGGAGSNILHDNKVSVSSTPVTDVAAQTVSATDSALDNLLAHNFVTANEVTQLHHLIDTGHADQAVNFCLNRSREILNAHTITDQVNSAKGISFLKDALRLAEDQHVQGAVAERLHATVQNLEGTLAYAETWGVSPTNIANTADALKHAAAAGPSMGNIGSRLMPFLKARMPRPA